MHGKQCPPNEQVIGSVGVSTIPRTQHDLGFGRTQFNPIVFFLIVAVTGLDDARRGENHFVLLANVATIEKVFEACMPSLRSSQRRLFENRTKS